MSNHLNILCYKLLTEESYQVVMANWERLAFIATCFAFDTDYQYALNAICEYAKTKHEMPHDWNDLIQFCEQADPNGPQSQFCQEHFVTKLQQEIDGLKAKDFDKDIAKRMSNLSITIETCYRNVMAERDQWIGSEYARISGSADNSGPAAAKHKKEKLGHAAAMAWVREQWALEPKETVSTSISGFLHERVGDVVDAMERELDSKESTRMLTFLPRIDEKVIINKKSNAFIGLLGFTGEGKSLLLHTLAYNWAKQGYNILYNSLEFPAERIIGYLAFLHSEYFEREWTLPSITQFRKKAVNATDREHLRTIAKDLQSGKSIPGRIEVLDANHLDNWDAIEEHLLAHNDQNRYDVLICDYIGKLKTPGVKDRERNVAIDAVFDRAALLSQSFAGQGLVVVSPLQVNREGRKGVAQRGLEEADYELWHVQQHSRAYQNMDLVFTVYSGDEYKANYKMKVCCRKAREDEQPAPMLLDVDRNSHMVKGGRTAQGTLAATAPPGVEQPLESWEPGISELIKTMYGDA